VKTLAAWLLTLFALYTPSRAQANGRFPKAEGIVTVPGGDGRAMALVATFGVLWSKDGGASWRWICEPALGFSGTWDPPVVMTKDGRLWVGLPDGLRVTTDGCDAREIPELHGELVADLSLEPGGERVVAVTSTPDKPAFVWRQKANGVYARLGKGVERFAFDTIDVAASDESRVYATAAPVAGGGRRAHFFRSKDGGATLEELDVALEKDGRLFLSAIDPKAPDRVFVRHANELGTDLLVSADGGRSFKRVLHTASSMFGFAASADGGAYWAGAGDAAEGIFRSRDRGETWEVASRTSVLCLHADGPRLFACSNPYTKGGWAAAVSTDGASTFHPLASFDEVAGPIACAKGAGAQCVALWPDVRAQITSQGKPEGTEAEPPSPSAAPSSAPSIAPPAKRACGCAAHGPSEPGAATLALLTVLALAARRRLDRAAPRPVVRSSTSVRSARPWIR
jgi:hypothetical protein